LKFSGRFVLISAIFSKISSFSVKTSIFFSSKMHLTSGFIPKIEFTASFTSVTAFEFVNLLAASLVSKGSIIVFSSILGLTPYSDTKVISFPSSSIVFIIRFHPLITSA